MVMGQLTTNVDVAVIGAGPGGYTAAIRAAQLGMEVVIIEKNKMGGTCTNVGCIPSKAMIHAADVKHEAESDSAKKMGIDARINFDFRKTQQWKDGVVADLRNGVTSLCKSNGIEVVNGTAFFTSSNTLSVETETGIRAIQFKKAVIATGTVIKEVPGLPVDHKRIINSDDVFTMQEIPKKMIIVGGGYIAVEMANMFMKFGSSVTLVHRGKRLLKRMEPEIAEALLKKMKEFGCEVLFESEISSVQGGSARIKTPQGERSVEFDRILVAAGRVPYTEGLGLDKTAVKLNEEGRVIVDETRKTTDQNIYAIGDVVPGPQLAHVAFREGKVAAEAIAGMKSAFDNRGIPMVVFSDPEIAVVGLTEDEAKEQGYKVKVGKMPFSASGKAKAMNRTDGFVKVVAEEESGAIIGVHIVGAGASATIAEGTLALEMGALLEDVAATIHAHPTLPEALSEAAEEALGTVIHLYKGKKQ
jgi:dihydrolipoamide dehydrogenase